MYINNPNAATQAANISQFGGNAVATGTGVGGNGVPRVTVSSDSFSSTVFVTIAPVTVNATSFANYAPNAACVETFISNLDAALTIYVRDTAANTDAQGIPVGPKSTLILQTTSALRLTNGGATNVAVNINERRTP